MRKRAWAPQTHVLSSTKSTRAGKSKGTERKARRLPAAPSRLRGYPQCMTPMHTLARRGAGERTTSVRLGSAGGLPNRDGSTSAFGKAVRRASRTSRMRLASAGRSRRAWKRSRLFDGVAARSCRAAQGARRLRNFCGVLAAHHSTAWGSKRVSGWQSSCMAGTQCCALMCV